MALGSFGSRHVLCCIRLYWASGESYSMCCVDEWATVLLHIRVCSDIRSGGKIISAMKLVVAIRTLCRDRLIRVADA